MIAVWVVQMTIHQVIHVIAVWHRFVSAAGTMDVILGMFATVVLRGAAGRVAGIHSESVFLDHACGLMVQMPIVEVIHVPFVLNGSVATLGSMLMVVSVMMVSHVNPLLPLKNEWEHAPVRRHAPQRCGSDQPRADLPERKTGASLPDDEK